MKKEVECFLYPDEVLKEKKELLIERYLEDYGEEYQSMIENRMNHTLYLFDSNPIITMNMMRDFEGEIDSKEFNRIYLEYLDYKKIFDHIHKRINKKYSRMLSSYFSVSSFFTREDLLSLDIESYSLKILSFIRKSEEGSRKRDELIHRQEEYLKKCKEIGVTPLTNPISIQFLLDEKKRLEEYEYIFILKNTKWGKRIVRKIKSYYPKIRISEIVKIMRDDAVALTSYLLDTNGSAKARVLYYPLLQDFSIQSLDRIFYHENRHVIESNRVSSGLHLHVGDTYQYLNEVRTEENALLDLDYFNDDFMWSSEPLMDGYHNTYHELYYYVKDFFDENRDILNDLAIRGDLSGLEEKFGKDSLIELECFLRDLSSVLKEKHFHYSSSEKEKKGKTLVHQLNDRFHRQSF